MELWTNLETTEYNLTQTGASEQNGRTQSRQRLNDRAILSLLRHWLLQEYVPAYCRSLAASRIFRRCYIVDALGVENTRAVVETGAGSEAVVEPGKGRKKGQTKSTPVPAALKPISALAQILAQDKLPITLNGFLLSAGTGRRQTGKKQEPVDYTGTIPRVSSVLQTSWQEARQPILNEIDQSPAIFLLNPLQPGILHGDDLAPLYQRTIPTELCLLFPHKQLLARVDTARQDTVQGMNLTSLLRGSRWKSLPKPDKKGREHGAWQAEIIAGMLDLMCEALRRYFQLPPQLITLSIQNGAASTIQLPYTLLFATRRQESLLNMNDAICSYQRGITWNSYQGVLGQDWFEKQERERQSTGLQELERRIVHSGRTQRIRRWPDLRQQFVLAEFGYYTQHEYDQIIVRLLSNNVVSCAWRQIANEDVRVPGNNDTLMWQ